MKQRSRQHTTDIIFMLGLFALFTVSALILVVIGSKVYRNIADTMGENYRLNTAVSYVANKVRSCDVSGDITLSEIDGVKMLIIEQTFDDVEYQTLIYHHEGKLKELFIEKSREFDLTYGQEILEVESFDIVFTADNLYTVTAGADDGKTLSLAFSLRSN